MQMGIPLEPDWERKTERTMKCEWEMLSEELKELHWAMQWEILMGRNLMQMMATPMEFDWETWMEISRRESDSESQSEMEKGAQLES
eukprot:gene23709-biopygen15537